MQRTLFRVAALALSASALSACSMMAGGDKVAAAAPRPAETSAAAIAADVTSVIHQAQALRAKGDLDGEMHIISQLMLAQPDDARVVGEYGKLLVQQGRSNDAVAFLHRAVELAPSDWTFYSALGVAYDQLADPANAKLAYEHALVLKPGEAAVLNNYGMSRMLAGDAAGARALMLQAKASGSTDPKIDSNLALLDSTAPVKPTPAPVTASIAPVTQAAPIRVAKPTVVSHAATPAVSHVPTAVVTKPIAPVTTASAVAPSTANAAPTVITHNGTKVVMQAIPVDPKAGPVAHWTPAKPAKGAVPAVNVAAAVPAKSAKADKSAKPAPLDHIPALRMTADAGKP
jgi:Flp pilus assembly protein TadD